MKVLLIEADNDFAAPIAYALNNADMETAVCFTAMEAVGALQLEPPDIILLRSARDYHPIGLLRTLKGIRRVPILILEPWPQNDEEYLRRVVEALDMGADDYIRAPQNMREIEARIKSLVRRTQEYTLLAPMPVRQKPNLRLVPKVTK
ncbi:response regulator transcription factor [Acetobacteraceae bacterium]|nr:response regulator transcription factor [Candidatus Parcubacteria bacterium]